MIVHFLVRTESMSVTEVSKTLSVCKFVFCRCLPQIAYFWTSCAINFQAISKFAMVRDPGIYKQDYIDALYMFYHERKPEEVVCPQTPEWKRLSDFDFHSAVAPTVENIGDVPLHVCVLYLIMGKILFSITGV